MNFLQKFISVLIFHSIAFVALGQSNIIDLVTISEWTILDNFDASPNETTVWTNSPIDSALFMKPISSKSYWFKLDRNNFPKNGLIRVLGQDQAQFFTPNQLDGPSARIGYYLPMHRLPIKGKREFVDLSTFSTGDRFIYCKVKSFNERPYPIKIKYYNQEAFDQWALKTRGTQLPFYFLIGGGSIALMILAGFALFFYFIGRKPAYFYYALYLVAFALYFFRLLEYQYQVPFFWGYLPRGFALAEGICVPLTYVLYMLFVKHFLSLTEASPVWRLFKLWIYLSTGVILFQIMGAFFQTLTALGWDVFTIFRFATIPFVVYSLWLIHRQKFQFGKYIIWGTLMLLVTGMMALFIAYIFVDFKHPILSNTFFIMLVGVLLESFCFALGLGASARQDELDMIATQDKLITQLTREAALESEVQESRIQTLTAQMNPHFIFNALSSIQHFILSDEKKKSIKYLSKFAKLVRGNLENSASRSISLDKEFEMLNAYVDIEQMRFQKLFTFEVIVEASIIMEETYIPHMAIQPFIENSILHGLMPLKGNGKLSVSINQKGSNRLKVVIQDNGVGRKKAKEIGKSRSKDHQSISINSIDSRLKSLMPEINNPVVYEDLVDEAEVSEGTQVTIILPMVDKH